MADPVKTKILLTFPPVGVQDIQHRWFTTTDEIYSILVSL
jgi:hypothetical protein